VHAVALELSLGRPLREDEVARHSCDVTLCCNPAHLLPGTQFDNIQDRVARGRNGDIRGQKNKRAILTDDDVRYIRYVRMMNHRSRPWLAQSFGVCVGTIKAVARRTSWKHL
jgi:alpha/beta superfamily hydrolase